MLKKLFLMGVTLIVIVVIAAIAIPYFVPENSFKAPLLNKIRAMTGCNVTVGGRFQLRLFPSIGGTLEDVTISNPPPYDTQPLAKLKSLDVNIAVLPLLKGNIEINKLVMDEPQFNLHVTKEGVNSWQPSPPTSQPVSKTPPTPSSAAIPLPRNLLLGDVKIENGTVAYNDEEANVQWEIKKLNIGLALHDLSSPFAIDATGEWRDKEIKIKGTLDSLQTLFKQARTRIDADINSELLSVTAHGFLIDGIRYTGKAEIKSPSLKAALAWINPTGTPIQTPAKLALNLSSDMDCAIFKCSLTNASLTLDNIEAKGSISAIPGGGDKQPPQIDLNLTTGVLDFNPFMSAQHADASGLPTPERSFGFAQAGGLIFADAHAETNGRWSDKPIDFSIFKAISGTANIMADGIVVNKITLGKMTLRAKLENGRLNADIVDAVMYGGKGNITLNVDTASATPAFQKIVSLRGVQVQPLFKDALDMSRLSGAADITVNATSSGKSESELVSHTAGNGQFKLTNGAIEGVDLTSLIANKSTGGAEKTPINDMQGTFTIAQGIVSNRDLTMTLPTLHVSGQGSVNLPAFTIDYHLTPQMVQADDKGGAAKQGIAVPVIVEGSLDKPNFRPDLNAVAQQALKNPQAFKDQLKNTRDSLKNGLSNPNTVKNIRNLLQGF